MPDPSSPFDPKRLRAILGTFATGVTVVTTLGERGQPVGLTINSFSSVSLDPPMILWSLALRAPSLKAFRHSDCFAINILAAQQQELCRRFATPAIDKFAGVEHSPGVTGAPLLSGAVAHIECRIAARYPGGDHEIYLGEIEALEDFGHEPLLFHKGQFRRFAPGHNLAGVSAEARAA